MKIATIVILTCLVFSASGIVFAENQASCNFGKSSTPIDKMFERDLAVKAFVERHSDATRSIPVDESGSVKNQFVLHAENNDAKETLKIIFHTDENGCFIPASYQYSYNDGLIDIAITNSAGNFTEIFNLIKSDEKRIEDFYPANCEPVKIQAMIPDGKFYGACKSNSSISITSLVRADSQTMFSMNIPRSMVYNIVSKDCKETGNFFVILDGQEVKSTIKPTGIGYSVAVELPEGFHRIEVVGSVILPSPSPVQYCGIVEGYQKQYLSPLDQIDREMEPTSVRCNNGLVLVQKYDGSPACVTESTKLKLIERGWAKSTHEISESTKRCSDFGTAQSNFDQFKEMDRTWISISKVPESESQGNCVVLTQDELQRYEILGKLISGADKCADNTIYCGGGRISIERTYPFGFSVGDQKDYELSWSPNEDLGAIFDGLALEVLENTGYGTIKHGDNFYQVIVNTANGTGRAQTNANVIFTADSNGQIHLEKGSSVQFTYSVETFATFGKDAKFNIFARDSAIDSGLDITVEPSTLTIPERSKKNATVTISAGNDANDGIYKVIVSGRNADTNGLGGTDRVIDHPKINIGNSKWELVTHTSSGGSGIGGTGPMPEWTWAELDINDTELETGDTAEFSAYIVNNGTEQIILDDRAKLIIKVIKADSSEGFYDHVYEAVATLADGEKFVIEPNSKNLIARSFYWDQTTQSDSEEPQRVKSKKYRVDMVFGFYDSKVWRDSVWIEVK